MSILLKNVLSEISNIHGLKAFINRHFLCEVLSNYLNTDYKKEAKLLIRVAKAGYVANIAKSNKVKNKEIINRQLHEDESIDKKIVEQLVDSLFDVINQAKIREANIMDEIKKDAVIAEQKERELKHQKMHEVLEEALKKILKSYGLNVLDDYDLCRALLKDMANGDYVEEITVISILLKRKIHSDKHIKRNVLKKSMEELSVLLSNIYWNDANTDIDVKSLIMIIIKNILELEIYTKNDAGSKKWIINFFKLLKK
ncbi:MAG: hypothetical protein LBR10_00740 [Prevotellaceae bacterium]|jgi:hypothetical protein|nr:hypothetical protein [Prevotellaceae bacterium]